MFDDTAQAVVCRLADPARIASGCGARVLFRHGLDGEVQRGKWRSGAGLDHFFLLAWTVWIGIGTDWAVHRRTPVVGCERGQGYRWRGMVWLRRPNEMRGSTLATSQSRKLPSKPRHELFIARPLGFPRIALRSHLADIHTECDDFLL